jgi:hypothetical protein
MMVAFFIPCAFAVLDRLLRAPLDAGKALFTAVMPGWRKGSRSAFFFGKNHGIMS